MDHLRREELPAREMGGRVGSAAIGMEGVAAVSEGGIQTKNLATWKM